MQNDVLSPVTQNRSGGDRPTTPAAARSLSRALAARQDAHLREFHAFVDAAYEVMARSGGIDPKVSDIVAEAGLSNTAFYRNFDSKDELLLAVLDDGRQRLVDYLARRMAPAPTPLLQ